MTIDMNKEYTAEEIFSLDLPIGTVLIDYSGDYCAKEADGNFRFCTEVSSTMADMSAYAPYTIHSIPQPEQPPFPEPDWNTKGWTPTWIPVWVRREEVSDEITRLSMRRHGGAHLVGLAAHSGHLYLDEWSTYFGTEPPLPEKPKWNEAEAGVSLEEAKRIAKLLSEFEEKD